MEAHATQEERQSFWQSIKAAYEGLIMTVIRPMRAVYQVEDLGPTSFMIEADAFCRTDMTVKNSRNHTLQCSWWKPANESKCLPCIVSLHGNSSCRLGCMDMMAYALEFGYTVFAFDFSGSGMSEGEYVSLGYHESNDIDSVVKFLRSQEDVSSIILWGRSMGSVAALMYAERDPGIGALVLDSPFTKLSSLALDLVDEGKLNVPKIAVSLVMRLVRNSIKKRADFDMFKLKPISHVDKCFIPAFYGVGMEDELIPVYHTEELFHLHSGPKEILKFPGGHNTPRPDQFFMKVMQFVSAMIGMEIKERHSQRGGPSRLEESNPVVPDVKNPLPPGVSIESVHKMPVKELKLAINRAGFSGITCVEKGELIDLVLKLFERYACLFPLEAKKHEAEAMLHHTETLRQNGPSSHTTSDCSLDDKFTVEGVDLENIDLDNKNEESLRRMSNDEAKTIWSPSSAHRKKNGVDFV